LDKLRIAKKELDEKGNDVESVMHETVEEKIMLQTLYEVAQSDFRRIKEEISKLQTESNISLQTNEIQEKTCRGMQRGMMELLTLSEKQENDDLKDSIDEEPLFSQEELEACLKHTESYWPKEEKLYPSFRT
jgi:hypothetical protein